MPSESQPLSSFERKNKAGFTQAATHIPAIKTIIPAIYKNALTPKRSAIFPASVVNKQRR